MRSVYLQKNKSVFKVEELPAERFAASLGLPGAPKIKFLAKEAAKKRKNASYFEKTAASNTKQSDTGSASEGGESDESVDEGESSGSESGGENKGVQPSQEIGGRSKKVRSTAKPSKLSSLLTPSIPERCTYQI